MTYSHAFSRALCRLHAFASNSDWFIVLFAAAVIVQSITLVLILEELFESKNPSRERKTRVSLGISIQQKQNTERWRMYIRKTE